MKKACEICGYTSRPRSLVTYRIIPEEVAIQAGILDSRTVVLCISCSMEVQAWCAKKAFSMSYDAGTKRFVPKSSAEIVKEYEAAYKAFITYKSGCKSRTDS